MANESFETEIAKLEKEVQPLRAEHEKLRRKFEADQVEMARYSQLADEKERLEKEIAAMKRGHFRTPPHPDENEDHDS